MSNASTIRYSSAAGVDWAALIAGLGLGLTVAMQVTTMTYSDISSPYALITSFSRLCALVVQKVQKLLLRHVQIKFLNS
jgi:hypothetical protein